MIITRTPFRISFVGGGTDLPSFFQREYGQVLSTSINKYIYVVAKKQIGIVEFKYRINWSQVEMCNRIEDIEHPIVKVVLEKHNIDFPIQITTFSDIPANTGLGSSSAFTVGLLHAIYAMKEIYVSQQQLAAEAAEIEIDVLGRVMGKQDHYASAMGGVNTIRFNEDNTVEVEPVAINTGAIQALENNLVLFYTQMKRDASDVLKSQDKSTVDNFDTMRQMRDLVEPLKTVLQQGDDLTQIGHILDKSWKLKRSLTSDISTSDIDLAYERAIAAGAIGGKILGAGGGGFLLFYIPIDKQDAVIAALPDLYHIKIGFDKSGTGIRYVDPDN